MDLSRRGPLAEVTIRESFRKFGGVLCSGRFHIHFQLRRRNFMDWQTWIARCGAFRLGVLFAVVLGLSPLCRAQSSQAGAATQPTVGSSLEAIADPPVTRP